MSSQEIKERIEHYFNCTGVPTSEKDWKRVRKFKLPNCSYDIREFHNTTLGRTIYTVGDDEDVAIYELDQWVYGVFEDPEEDALAVCFEPIDRWKRRGYVYDQHQHYLLDVFHNLPGTFDEVQENMFIVDDPSMTELKLHILLNKFGFKHEQSITDFLKDPSKRVVPQPALAPVNPPQPPALSGTPVPVIASGGPVAASQGPSGGYYNTGLEEDGSPVPSDFLFTVFTEMDPRIGGEVRVVISPRADYEAGGRFDQSIGPIVDHLLPSDWDEDMEQHYLPGAMTADQAYDLLINAGFQRSDKHDAMYEHEPSYVVYKPGSTSASQVTPAAGLQNASDFLFTMVDQYDGWTHVVINSHQQWLDDDELTNSFIASDIAHLIPNDWTEVSEGLFKCGNLAMAPAWTILDAAGFQEDADFEDVVREEYDQMSVGWTLGQIGGKATIPSTPRTSRPAPRIGPSPSQITGSGSFAAPVVPDDEEEPEEAVLPEVHLENDAGDEKVKFRKEFWEAWQAKDPSITTLRLRWYDRYRERKAEVTGLGFAYHLPEYTGVKLLMGYLDEEGKLIDNVTLPVSVVEEIFKDFGGEFEGGQVQFVYKKPDTSAQDLWEELEPMLIALGWTKVS